MKSLKKFPIYDPPEGKYNLPCPYF